MAMSTVRVRETDAGEERRLRRGDRRGRLAEPRSGRGQVGGGYRAADRRPGSPSHSPLISDANFGCLGGGTRGRYPRSDSAPTALRPRVATKKRCRRRRLGTRRSIVATNLAVSRAPVRPQRAGRRIRLPDATATLDAAHTTPPSADAKMCPANVVSARFFSHPHVPAHPRPLAPSPNIAASAPSSLPGDQGLRYARVSPAYAFGGRRCLFFSREPFLSSSDGHPPPACLFSIADQRVPSASLPPPASSRQPVHDHLSRQPLHPLLRPF